MALLSRHVLKRDPCCEGGHDHKGVHKGLGALSLAAMAMCSINDGLLIGLAQPAWHSGLNLGMFLHKITSSFAIAQVLMRGGYRGPALLGFGFAYALVSPVALLGAGSAARALPGMEMVLGFSAGILAYVALASLAPACGRHPAPPPRGPSRLRGGAARFPSASASGIATCMAMRPAIQASGHPAIRMPRRCGGTVPADRAWTPHRSGLGRRAMKDAGADGAARPFLDRLRRSHVKVTPNRLRVLERFLAGEGAWTLGSLQRSLSQSGPCETSSVYRALEALRGAGVLEEFRLPGEKQTYYSLIRADVEHAGRAPRDHHHHHIVCRDCGRVSHLDVCLPSAWLGKVEGASGFRITEHHLEFKGVCKDCG